MKQLKSKRLAGFTLLEMLVVIFIIAIISTLAYVSLEGARSKGRDTRRLSDVNQLRQALELYRDSEGSYPANLPTSSQPLVGGSGRTYLAPVPCDPRTRLPYGYSLTPTGDYRLIFSLERESNGYPAGENIVMPLNDEASSGN